MITYQYLPTLQVLIFTPNFFQDFPRPRYSPAMSKLAKEWKTSAMKRCEGSHCDSRHGRDMLSIPYTYQTGNKQTYCWLKKPCTTGDV